MLFLAHEFHWFHHAGTLGEQELAEGGLFPFIGYRDLVVSQLPRSFKYLPKISAPLSLKGAVAHLYNGYVCTIFVLLAYIAMYGNYILLVVGILLASKWVKPGGTGSDLKHVSKLWITFCLCLLSFCKNRRYLAENLGCLDKIDLFRSIMLLSHLIFEISMNRCISNLWLLKYETK